MAGVVEFALGFAVGLGVSLGSWAGARWASRRRESRAVRPVPADGAATAAPGATSLPPTPADAPAPPRGVVARTRDPSEPGQLGERVALSQRIIVHLFVFRGFGPDDLARPESTQSGIAAVLGADQRAISKVLRRLVAATVVVEERRHVRGSARRVKVYSLTRRGEGLAIDLRRRQASGRREGTPPHEAIARESGPY